MSASLGGLYIYPIKSAAGIACDSVELTADGFRHDREWMIVDAQGRGITQREDSRLALLHTAIHAQCLHISNPQGAGPRLDVSHQGNGIEVQVWGSRCRAFDAGKEAARFLSDWLGKSLRLVRFDTSRPRLSNHDWTEGRDVSTLFSDGYPLLVLSRASIADLAARVGRDLPVERFRPNVLLDGVSPYAEDNAHELLAGDASLQLTKACTRCVITTIDHMRGERTDDEPLRTLKTYRFDAALRGVVFGRNAYATAGIGTQLLRCAAVTLSSRA
jgi:uncharacterized protein YcbX